MAGKCYMADLGDIVRRILGLGQSFADTGHI